MILYIAEKPSLGRAIADVLPKPHKKGEGFVRAGNGDVVTWCIGHLLEQAEPDAYDPAYKKWTLESLPIVPDQWQLKPKPKTRKQLSVIRKLMKEADQLVHAGDPDREGQLLVDEVIEFIGLPAAKKATIQRCLISDLNPPAVKRALSRLRENRDFIPLSTSALARSRADWLYGMNMTRAYTLQGQKAGYNGVLSVGRVQTPVLGLVVRRDREIEAFQPKPFYEVIAHLVTPDGSRFTAKWQPSEACRPYQDEDGRVLSRPLAENVANRITDKTALLSKLEQKEKQQAAPLPYSLSSLQIDAAKRFGMSAQQVLDGCQALYEKHKLITYPRSDSRYLPVEQHAQAPSVISAINSNCAEFEKAQGMLNPVQKSKAWNDKKVDAHHAIIPTAKNSDLGRLGKTERQIYELVARQYLYQFLPAYRYFETKVEVMIEGGRFTTTARQPLEQGWKILLGKQTPDKDDAEQQTLPALTQGQNLHSERGEVIEKITQPPKYFTDATLLAAMTGISRYVTDSDIRKVLKDTDGLGTEATRAGIIELLFKRGFLSREGKAIRATEAGGGLVDALPDSASKPDMTAHWESQLDAISQKHASYQSFMSPLLGRLNELIAQAVTVVPSSLQGLPSKPVKRRRKRAAGTGTRSRKTTSSKRKQSARDLS
ncbi:DNA topoisomerase III [Pontibacterium sp. N1Y112]|uniref:DNA topoisomerase 3 n=1 Tax=Pontibacterium sinense TaxID=2781979 RepID=A0A8J7FBN0_9GAMM|nr:DNA topoisomerase III [Pontibacterium sinense]MBE9397117.1 DNA topoisomerase III [Pontibacterium sinense]